MHSLPSRHGAARPTPGPARRLLCAGLPALALLAALGLQAWSLVPLGAALGLLHLRPAATGAGWSEPAIVVGGLAARWVLDRTALGVLFRGFLGVRLVPAPLARAWSIATACACASALFAA